MLVVLHVCMIRVVWLERCLGFTKYSTCRVHENLECTKILVQESDNSIVRISAWNILNFVEDAIYLRDGKRLHKHNQYE